MRARAQLGANGRDDKGYTLVAFAQPLAADIPPGCWSLSVSYAAAAPSPDSGTAAPAAGAAKAAAPVALQELPAARVAAFEGAYAHNERGVLARCAGCRRSAFHN